MIESEAPTLLLVDDDAVFRGRLARALEGRGFRVTEAETGDAAIRFAEAQSPEFAVVDLRMPGMDGLAVVDRLHRLDETTRIVMLTGYGSIRTTVDAMRAGAADYLTKPADADQIVAALLRGREVPDGVEAPADANPAPAPSLARVEWEHIQRVVHDCGGNISKAAKVLGLHRRSLQRKLSKHPVRR